MKEAATIRANPGPGACPEPWPRSGHAPAARPSGPGLPPVRLLELGLVPDVPGDGAARDGGPVTLHAIDPDRVTRHLPELRRAYGEVRVLAIDPVTHARRSRARLAVPLARQAELRRPASRSCRSTPLAALGAGILALTLLGLAALLVWPGAAQAGLVALALAASVPGIALKLAALVASCAPPPTARPAVGPVGEVSASQPVPTISLLVPLYREGAMLRLLLDRLARLSYPRDRLDVLFVVEDDDRETARALDAVDLPAWVRVLPAPAATLRTKPRALNYALPFARGTIVGLYDAEDEPDRDQLLAAAAAFAQAPPEVVCLQGALDIANDRQSWITRGFALDYAGWFRVVLPGLVRLGLVVPLGGTTLFLRRAAIDAIGGWDAHNVTEDADLGLWIARRGWRTAMLASTTREEATASLGPWVRQRSRWLKGYAATCAAHLRAPRRLVRDLGPWRTAGLVGLMLAPLVQVSLAPALWGLWAGHVWAWPTSLPPALVAAGTTLGLVGLSTDLAIAALGAHRSGGLRRAAWAPVLLAYQPLATLAAWRAWGQLAAAPYKWDKTAHGLADRARPARARSGARRPARQPGPPKPVWLRAASSFRRVTKAREMWSRRAA